MLQLIIGITLIAGAAVLGFYGTQLAREGWSELKETPKASASKIPSNSVPDSGSNPDTKKDTVHSNNPTPATPNIGSNSVVSINQQGGITAGTVNLHSGPPPWGMSADNLTKLTGRMRAYASSRDRGDLITSVMGDPESLRFGSALVTSFRNAGWNLSGSGLSQAMYSGPVEGVILLLKSKDSKPAGLDAFVATLREAGIEPTGELQPDMPDSDFRIVVGSRPQR